MRTQEKLPVVAWQEWREFWLGPQVRFKPTGPPEDSLAFECSPQQAALARDTAIATPKNNCRDFCPDSSPSAHLRYTRELGLEGGK
jgi:hypothetical protein